MGLRDYRWLEDVLPARVGATDLDCVLEQHSTGRILVLEFKPNRYVPRGQAILFDGLLAQGFDIAIIIDKDHDDNKFVYSWWGENEWKETNLAGIRRLVRTWWNRGDSSNKAKGGSRKTPRRTPVVRSPSTTKATHPRQEESTEV